MYDLATLNRMNEESHQNHLRAVERANEEKAQRSDPQISEPVFPLSVLARKLITGPLSLAALVDLLNNSETIVLFRELVRELLPEHEADIMAADTNSRIARFIFHFNKRYFPLSEMIDFDEYDLEEFLDHIPVELMGFSYEDFHQYADFRDGYVLMLALVTNPYEDSEDGGRVPIIESAAKMVDPGLLDMIPADGFSTEVLHKKLDGTKYSSIPAFADWVNSETDCMLLNATYHDYGVEPWSRSIVETLTAEWPQVEVLQDEMTAAAAWFEENPRQNFREILFYLLDKEDCIVPKEQLPLPLD